MKRVYRFLRYNRYKKFTIYTYILTAYYRFMILTQKPKKYENKIGIRGQESPVQETEEKMKRAYIVGKRVCRIADKTPWESKCLVRALTARKILANEGIETTLYLGVGKEEGKVVAHAWLRCGECYVTGGNGANYAMVAKFLCK